MILRRLRLSNFRQFRGEHALAFAFDERRNVTIILGMNGAGKTGLFYALNWVLYGEASALPGTLINKAAVAEDQLARAWVQLEFIHEGSEYVARRELERMPTGTEREGDLTLQILGSGGRVRQVPNPQESINVILPPDTRRYFFFDGERINELSRPGHEQEVRDAVRSVLKLKVLERAAAHLDEISKEYSRAFRALGELDQEQLRLVERSDAFAKSLREREEQLVGVRERVGIVRGQLDETRSKLDDLSEVRAIQARERDIEARRRRLEDEQTSISTALRRSVTDGSAILVREAASRALSVLEVKRVKGEIPSGVRQQFIDDLLREGVCICGRHLDGESRAELEVRRQMAVSNALVDKVLSATGELRGVEIRADETRKRLKQLVERRHAIFEELLDVERELESIHQSRASDFTEDVAQLEQTRRMLEGRYHDLLLEQGRLETDIERDGKQVEILRAKVTKLDTKSAQGRAARRRYELASAAAAAAQRMLAAFRTDMRARIEAATDEIFKMFVWKEKQFEQVRVTEDYRLEVEDRFHTATLAGLSAGERQVLSLAFIAGMSRVTGEEAPLVIDTPFGRLSEMPVASIARELPAIARQLVLFVTDREMDEESRAIIADRVGGSYTLVFDDETGATSIEAAA